MNTATFVRYSVTLLLLVIMSGSQAIGQEKLRLGLSSIGATNGSIWAAEEKGLFRKHGVDVEVIFIGGGGARQLIRECNPAVGSFSRLVLVFCVR